MDVIFLPLVYQPNNHMHTKEVLHDTFKIGKIALGFGHCQKNWQLYNYFTFSHCTARMAETSDSEEEPHTK